MCVNMYVDKLQRHTCTNACIRMETKNCICNNLSSDILGFILFRCEVKITVAKAVKDSKFRKTLEDVSAIVSHHTTGGG